MTEDNDDIINGEVTVTLRVSRMSMVGVDRFHCVIDEFPQLGDIYLDGSVLRPLVIQDPLGRDSKGVSRKFREWCRKNPNRIGKGNYRYERR